MKKFILLISILAFSVSTMQAQIRMPEMPKKKAYKDYASEEKGFWCAVEGGAGSTVEYGMRNAQIANLTFTGGYRFCEFLRVGAGIGCGYYFNNSDIRSTDNQTNIPVFANARGNIISQESRTAVPFWSVSLGTRVNDGWFARPSIGYRFGELRGSFLLSVCYEIGKIKLIDTEKKVCSSFHLSLGYEF